MVVTPSFTYLEHNWAYATWHIISRVHTRLPLDKLAYSLWHTLFITVLAHSKNSFFCTFYTNCRYIKCISVTSSSRTTSLSRLPSSSSSGLPSRTTLCIILPTISPFGLYGNHDGVYPHQIDTLIISIIQTPWYSPPLTSREKFRSNTLPFWHQGQKTDQNQNKVFLLL